MPLKISQHFASMPNMKIYLYRVQIKGFCEKLR